MTTICLDGTDKEALASYLSGIEEVINWSYEDGIKVDISDICGQCHEVFTTRAGGSMEVEFVYMGRSIRFLIQGRNLYLRGWKARDCVFELNHDQHENFTLDPKCIRLKTGLNYNKLVFGGVENTPTGLWPVRKAFDNFWRHAGGENINISEDVAIFAVIISEAARLRPVHDYIKDSFLSENPGLSKLGKHPSNPMYVKKYKKISAHIMENVDLMKQGLEPKPFKHEKLVIDSMESALSIVRILFRDAFNSGLFEHEKPPKPIFENTLDRQEVKHKRKQDKRKKKGKKGGGGSGGGGGGGSIGEEVPKGGGVRERLKGASYKHVSLLVLMGSLHILCFTSEIFLLVTCILHFDVLLIYIYDVSV